MLRSKASAEWSYTLAESGLLAVALDNFFYDDIGEPGGARLGSPSQGDGF
jgi:hypothetical protein